MTTKPAAKTKISEEGLRYRSKVAGSPFVSGASFGAATMSCFNCMSVFIIKMSSF